MSLQTCAENLPPTKILREWREAQSQNHTDSQVRLLPLSGSERRVFRLFGVDTSAIFIDARADKTNLAQPYLQRLEQLSKFFTAMGLRVPRIEGLDFANQCAIIEDFGDRSYASYLLARTQANCRELFTSALRSLLRIATLDNTQENGGDFSRDLNEYFLPVQDSLPAFSEHRFVEQTAPFYDFFISPQSTEVGKTADGASLVIWQGIWQKLYREARFQREEITIALGDIHIENMFVLDDATSNPSGEAHSCAFIDFQDAHFAPRCYDVVSLLEDGLWSMPRAWREELWTQYCNAFKSQKREQHSAARHYKLCALHRDIRMMGILYRLLYKRGRNRYGAWLARVAKNCARRLEEEPLFSDLHKFIEQSVPDWQQRIEAESRSAPEGSIHAHHNMQVPGYSDGLY